MATWTNKCSVEKKLCKNRAFSHKVICSPFLHRCTLDLRSFFVGTLGLRLIVMHGNLDQQVQRREKVVQKSCFSHKVICSPFLHGCTLELRSFFVGTLGLRLIVMHCNLDQQVQRKEKVVEKSCVFP